MVLLERFLIYLDDLVSDSPMPVGVSCCFHFYPYVPSIFRMKNKRDKHTSLEGESLRFEPMRTGLNDDFFFLFLEQVNLKPYVADSLSV